jgi:hypothetical protein
MIRKLKLKLTVNKYKFEEKFLFKLSTLISKFYGKKVEFNIVNLKSISYNSDIFTEILALKLKKEKSNPMAKINSLLAKAVLPHHNIFFGKVQLYKLTDLNLLENKYKNVSVSNILNRTSDEESYYKDNLNKLLYDLYYKSNMNVLSRFNKKLS